jgi:hypothetical protein
LYKINHKKYIVRFSDLVLAQLMRCFISFGKKNIMVPFLPILSAANILMPLMAFSAHNTLIRFFSQYNSQKKEMNF